MFGRPTSRYSSCRYSSLDPAAVAGPFLLAERELLWFAGRRARQFVDELDRLRHLVAGDVGLQVTDQLGLVELGARLAQHEGLRPLAPLLVRNADDGDLEHRRVSLDGVLDLD